MPYTERWWEQKGNRETDFLISAQMIFVFNLLEHYRIPPQIVCHPVHTPDVQLFVNVSEHRKSIQTTPLTK